MPNQTFSPFTFAIAIEPLKFSSTSHHCRSSVNETALPCDFGNISKWSHNASNSGIKFSKSNNFFTQIKVTRWMFSYHCFQTMQLLDHWQNFTMLAAFSHAPPEYTLANSGQNLNFLNPTLKIAAIHQSSSPSHPAILLLWVLQPLCCTSKQHSSTVMCCA